VSPNQIELLRAEDLALDEAKLSELTDAAWRAGDLRYKMHAPQLLIRNAMRSLAPRVRYRIAECARGFGKSWLDVMMSLEDALKFPNTYPVRIFGPELKQAREIIVPIMEVITSDAPAGMVTHKSSTDRWEIVNGKCENEIILHGFNRESIRKVRGQRAKSIYIEEARDVDEDDYERGMVNTITPMVIHSWGGVNLFTTPPEDLDHPYDTHTVPLAQTEGAYYVFTIHDNPTLDSSQKEQAARDMGGVHTAAYKREYLCQRTRDGSRVLVPSFNPAAHVAAMAVPTHCSWITALDGGGTRDKTVALLCFWDFLRAKFCVLDESPHDPGTDSGVISQATRDMERRHIFPALAPEQEPTPAMLPPRIADLTGQLQIDMRTLHNFATQSPIKEEFESTINLVDYNSRMNKIEVHPRCVLTIATLTAGRFDKQRKDFQRTAALGHCDAFMALVYGLRSINKTNPFPAYADAQFFQKTQVGNVNGSSEENLAKAFMFQSTRPHGARQKRR